MELAEYRPLMDHQQACLDWIQYANIQHPALFMEMRLGKTLAAVRTIRDIWELDTPCLVVAPTTVLSSWEMELTKEDECYAVLHGLPKEKRISYARAAFEYKTRLWLLINYDSLRCTPEITNLDWGAVILDESTAIKNPRAAISKLVTAPGVFTSVQHKLVLSGLPSPEGLMDLYQQFKFLHGNFLSCSNFYQFRAMHGLIADSFGGWDLRPASAQLVKKEVHKLGFVLRRFDVQMEGVKIREIREIELEPEQRDLYEIAEDEFVTAVSKDGEIEIRETQSALTKSIWMSRIAGGCDASGVMIWPSKIKELLNLLQGELREEAVVIWFRFNSELRACETALTHVKIPVGTLIGEDKREDRTATLDWFRNSRIPGRVLLCQVALAKYGVDCSAADTAIYFSMVYSAEAIAQSEDRILHPMKKAPLLYIYLVASDTIDEDVAYAVDRKITNAREFMATVANHMQLRRSR